MGNVVEQKSVAELPLNGRNPLTLLVLEPGVVSVPEWRPGSDDPRPLPAEVAWNGGVARKP